MAYINSDVYGNGISDTVLGSNNNIFIALLNEENQLLAFSEIRKGAGTDVENTETATAPTKINQFGTYSNSVLNINKISYSRTASKVATGLDDTQATQFAIVHYTSSTTADITAYEGSVFKGPSFGNGIITLPNTGSANNCKVLVKGTLSSPVTINASSNFMFAGATITFSAQDVQ